MDLRIFHSVGAVIMLLLSAWNFPTLTKVWLICNRFC